MNNQLALQKNSNTVNQYAKTIVKAVINKIIERNDQEIGIFDEEFDALGIPGIKYLTTTQMVALDYGWLMYENLLEYFKHYGKSFHGILGARSNTKNWNRSNFVHCPSVVKGQRLLVITIHLYGSYKQNFLVVNHKGKIVKSRFGAMQSHNWDCDSVEALALIHHSTKDDYEMEEA